MEGLFSSGLYLLRTHHLPAFDEWSWKFHLVELGTLESVLDSGRSSTCLCNKDKAAFESDKLCLVWSSQVQVYFRALTCIVGALSPQSLGPSIASIVLKLYCIHSFALHKQTKRPSTLIRENDFILGRIGSTAPNSTKSVRLQCIWNQHYCEDPFVRGKEN